MIETELALHQKLLETGHLSVPERRELPDGIARASLLIDLVKQAVQNAGRFPSGWTLDEEFSGHVIEASTDGKYRVHWKAEVAFLRYELVQSQTFDNLDQAAEQWLRNTHSQNIDGIPVDWTR